MCIRDSIMAISEMTPGPIAVNAATFVGIQVAGLPGALIATIGCIFPSCVIVMALAYICLLYTSPDDGHQPRTDDGQRPR